ncbi:hypothetical protein RJ55_08173 [Drechmeria coniospora]|nr:hypothetical protein RJ55_08173 [Drechmeria coniospora]
MQRVSTFLPSWERRHSNSTSSTKSATSKSTGGLFGWGKRSSASSTTSNTTPHSPRLPAKISIAAANDDRVQREVFWPATLDIECDRAARILKSFCTDGYLAPIDAPPAEEEVPTPTSTTDPPPTPLFVTKKIPKRVIQNAAGIAVFTCMRSGLWMTGSGGSGILIARKSDGTWSPPSGILLHTPTLSFIIGVDIYDCVLVINNLSALESISRRHVTLGDDVGLTNGPSVTLDSDEAHIKWKELGNTVLAYMKARGRHQAVNLNGCILTERGNENERFYGDHVTQMDILAGNVARHVQETAPLFEVIKLAEGRTDFDAAIIHRTAVQPAPGDAVIATPRSVSASPRLAFGQPQADDPDPFGVLALEMAGLEIREAGTRLRPPSSQFEYGPTPLSPAMSKFNRQSVETAATRSNRASVVSIRTARSDAATKIGPADTPETTPISGQSDDEQGTAAVNPIPEIKEADEVDYTRVDLTPLGSLGEVHSMGVEPAEPAAEPASTSTEERCGDGQNSAASGRPADDSPSAPSTEDEVEEKGAEEEETKTSSLDDESDDSDDMEDEEPVVFEVAAAQPARAQLIPSRVIQAKGNMVTIHKRVAPPLPKRSPARHPRCSQDEMGTEMASVQSPLRQAFSEADLKNAEDEDEARPRSAAPDDASSRDGSAEEVEVAVSRAGIATVAVDAAGDGQSDSSTSREPSTDDTVTEDAQPAQSGIGMALTADDDEEAEDLRGDEKETVETKDDNTVGPNGEETDATKDVVENTDDCDGLMDDSPADQTDSTIHKSHASSICTGGTEDRWSCDGSSLTASTLERPHSRAEEMTEEDTPKKLAKEVDSPNALGRLALTAV